MRWRRPALAPVYALVIAFVVVVAIGVFTSRSASASTVLRIDAGDGADMKELVDSAVEVRELSDVQVATGKLSAKGTYELPASPGGRKVCLRLPAQWQVTEPAMADGCTARPLADPPATDLRFTVVRNGRVAVVFQGGEAKFDGLTVAVRDRANPAYVESGPLDESGHYQPRRSLTGQMACVTPPFGWAVGTPRTEKRDGAQCTTDDKANPHDDVTLTLVKSTGGGQR
jgi:hypothetical protein